MAHPAFVSIATPQAQTFRVFPHSHIILMLMVSPRLGQVRHNLPRFCLSNILTCKLLKCFWIIILNLWPAIFYYKINDDNLKTPNWSLHLCCNLTHWCFGNKIILYYYISRQHVQISIRLTMAVWFDVNRLILDCLYKTPCTQPWSWTKRNVMYLLSHEREI